MRYIKKYWYILLIIIICIIRFLFSYKLPSFYLENLLYDDKLMVSYLSSLLNHNYLGNYSEYTLIKGIIFPLVMFYAKKLKISFSIFFTILFISSSLFFINSLKKIIKNKLFLLIIFIFIVWNPITYSSELFQRLYTNSIIITELLIFLGLLINILTNKNNNIFINILFGFISAIMLLTRNDNIWIFVILGILFFIKIHKKVNIKNIIYNLVPIFIVILIFNIFSYINYNAYGIYSYNELEFSNFKKVYNKVLQIKNKDKKDKVSIPRSTLYKLGKYTKSFDFTEVEIDRYYFSNDKEFDNGNSLWVFRRMIYKKMDFKNAKEANDYFYNLNKELDKAFKNGKLKRGVSFFSVFINPPTNNEIKQIPKDTIKAILYTSFYDNVKTASVKDLRSQQMPLYDFNINSYAITYRDYRHAEELVKDNQMVYEIIRLIYKYLTIVLSIPMLFVYLKNIKKKDSLNILIHLIVLIYIMVIMGVVYTHVTAFHAIRYRYLAIIYIVQSLFILLNIYRIYLNKKEKNCVVEQDYIISGTSTKRLKKVSVIIPAYNEERVIATTIKDIKKVMKKEKFSKLSEIIVINDGSIDNTETIAKRAGAKIINNPQNMGYGFSLKKGIQAAKNNIIVTLDADGTYPFSYVPKMLKIKEEYGFDLVIGARTGKYYRESFLKMILRKILKTLVEFVSGKKIKDINSGLRVFDKKTVINYFPRLCNTFSFSTSQTLAYLMNSHFVCYVDIPYNKRVGKTKVKLLRDSLKSLQYILESCIYYNPIKIFSLLSIICIILSFIGFFFSHFFNINAGYILGIGGILLSIVIFSLGLLAVLLKQIMDK